MLQFLRQNLLYSLIFFWQFHVRATSLRMQNLFLRLKKRLKIYIFLPEDYVYKCQMDIYKNHVSGILIIKKISETTHRVALTSDFGNKLIDFEVSDNDFKLNYVLPDLDKKIVINFLKNDFQQLLKKTISCE
jgi:hypothetical protein